MSIKFFKKANKNINYNTYYFIFNEHLVQLFEHLDLYILIYKYYYTPIREIFYFHFYSYFMVIRADNFIREGSWQGS